MREGPPYAGRVQDAARPPRRWVVVATGLGVAVAVTLLALALAGSADPPLLGDPGAVVRWGLPATAAIADLAGAVAVGALFLTAAVLPPRPTPPTGLAPTPPTGARAAVGIAAVAAGAWTVASLVRLLLTYANVAGRPLTSSGFGAELELFVTDIELGRLLLGAVLVAAVTSVVALLVTGPRSAGAATALAAVPLILQAQSGHASGATNHELAIGSMVLHLAGAALWVGGLATLALLARRLGPDLTDAVGRYSTLAAWCFAAVGISGVVNAALRLGGDLATTYGALVAGKVVLLGALGSIGWAHRRAVIPRLRERPTAFWRLAAVELAVMGAAAGLATALAATAPPVPTDAPTPGRLTPAEIVTGHPLPPAPTTGLWLTSFRWDLLLAVGCLAGVVVYLRWVLRLRARGDRWPVGRTISAVVGLVLLAWTTSGGPAVYGHVLFSAHMIQHMLLVMVVPVFLALCAPVTLAARALPLRRDGSRGPREWLLGVVHSRLAGFFSNPIVAAVNFAGSMVVFYYTDLFRLSLTTYLGHLLMVVHFSLAGYLFANVLVGVDPGPRRPSYPVRLLLLFTTMAFHAFFGLALVSGQTLLVPEWFGLLGRPWGPSALADQRAGGGIAWGISELPMLALAIALAVAWTRDDERTARRRDRAADRDGDAELAEYNAMLGRLAGRASIAGRPDDAASGRPDDAASDRPDDAASGPTPDDAGGRPGR